MLQGEGSISNRMGERRMNERDVAHSSTDCRESVIWKRLALNGWPGRQYYPNVRVSLMDPGDSVSDKTEADKTEAIVTMHIGELAENTGLSLRTIRHYDEVGLLKPSGRTEGGFRLYSQEDLSRLLLIRRMKPLGFSLGEMTDLLDIIDNLDADNADARHTDADPSPVRAELDRFIDETAIRREKLRAQVEMADEFLALLRSR